MKNYQVTQGFLDEHRTESLAYWLDIIPWFYDDYLFLGPPINIKSVVLDIIYELDDFYKIKGVLGHYYSKLNYALEIDYLVKSKLDKEINELLGLLTNKNSSYLGVKEYAGDILIKLDKIDYINIICAELSRILKEELNINKIINITKCLMAECAIRKYDIGTLAHRIHNQYFKKDEPTSIDLWVKKSIVDYFKEEIQYQYILFPILITSSFGIENLNTYNLCDELNRLTFPDVYFYDPKINPKFIDEEEDIVSVLSIANKSQIYKIHVSVKVQAKSLISAIEIAKKRLELLMDTLNILNTSWMDYKSLENWALLDSNEKLMQGYSYVQSHRSKFLTEKLNSPYKHIYCSFIYLNKIRSNKLLNVNANFIQDLFNKKAKSFYSLRTSIYWFRKALESKSSEIQLPLLWSSLEAISSKQKIFKLLPIILGSISFERLIFIIKSFTQNYSTDLLSFDRRKFIYNLFNKSEHNHIYLDKKINELKNISEDFDKTKKYINKSVYINTIMLEQCYRYRNMIVHGSFSTYPFVNFYSDYLKFVVGNMINGIALIAQHFENLTTTELLFLWEKSIIEEKWKDSEYLFNPLLFLSDILK